MKNIINYSKEFNKTFEERPFNEIDALVLAQLSYLNFQEIWEKRRTKTISIKELSTSKNKSLYAVRRGDDCKKLVQAMVDGTRFNKIKIVAHKTITDQSTNEQFSATAFRCHDIGFIAYRGTDRSVVGWSENFNMTYMEAVPSEIDAVKFLNNVQELMPEKFYIGGHSKGGHLSIFSATYCHPEIQNRIIRIFNFDGPGLELSKTKSQEYQNIEDKIITILPETSVFGIMLIYNSNYYVVKSNGFLLTQHEPFFWCIKYNSFVYERSLSPLSKRLKASMASYIQNTDPEKRQAFFTVFNDFMAQTNAQRPLDITLNFTKNIPIFFATYDKLPKEDLKEIRSTMWDLIKMFATLQTSSHSETTFKLIEGEKIHKEKTNDKKNNPNNLVNQLKKVITVFNPENKNQTEEKPDSEPIELSKPKISFNNNKGNSRSAFDIRTLLNFTGKQLDFIFKNKKEPPKAKTTKNDDSTVAINPDDITQGHDFDPDNQ